MLLLLVLKTGLRVSRDGFGLTDCNQIRLSQQSYITRLHRFFVYQPEQDTLEKTVLEYLTALGEICHCADTKEAKTTETETKSRHEQKTRSLVSIRSDICHPPFLLLSLPLFPLFIATAPFFLHRPFLFLPLCSPFIVLSDLP